MYLRKRRAPICTSRVRIKVYAITVGLRALTRRHLVIETDGLYAAQPHELAVLCDNANAIAPLLPLQPSDSMQSPSP
ncbi:hypothetical protein NKDENANG_00505 [Candidatus Entotheonellaceae bacterium PAL068K]